MVVSSKCIHSLFGPKVGTQQDQNGVEVPALFGASGYVQLIRPKLLDVLDRYPYDVVCMSIIRHYKYNFLPLTLYSQHLLLSFAKLK